MLNVTNNSNTQVGSSLHYEFSVAIPVAQEYIYISVEQHSINVYILNRAAFNLLLPVR